MSEKLASSEIAESREENLADRWAGEFFSTTYGMRPDKTHPAYKAARVCLMATYEAAERDTRERLAHPKMIWGWDIEEIKSAMRQFQSKHPGKLPSEIEVAERIRGKE